MNRTHLTIATLKSSQMSTFSPAASPVMIRETDDLKSLYSKISPIEKASDRVRIDHLYKTQYVPLPSGNSAACSYPKRHLEMIGPELMQEIGKHHSPARWNIRKKSVPRTTNRDYIEENRRVVSKTPFRKL